MCSAAESQSVVDETLLDRAAWERVAATGATYRQFDFWVRSGYIKAQSVEGGGSGRPRQISDEEFAVLEVMVDLVRIGMRAASAARLARLLASDGVIAEGRLQVTVAPPEPVVPPVVPLSCSDDRCLCHRGGVS